MEKANKKTAKIERIEKPEFKITPMLHPFVQQLKKSKNPRDLVLAQLAESVDINRQETQWQSQALIDTNYQARMTNGRVTRLEFLYTYGKLVGAGLLVGAIIYGLHDPEGLGRLLKFVWTISSSAAE